MKKAIFFIIAIVVVTLTIFLWQYHLQPKKMTFAKCEKIGGTLWRVDVFHPDICPTCESCYECGGDSYNFTNCPNCDTCFECMKQNFPYSDKCPGGQKKIAEISDAATWFQCCK